MKAVLMAGGKGTRMSGVTTDIPKPMIPIGGKPVMEHEIRCLKEQGFTDLILTVGHLHKVITDYFGDGRAFGVTIDYFVEPEPLGNAGALYRLKDKLSKDFLLLNADLMFDIDLKRFVAYHRSHGALATLFTHPNSHPYDSSRIVANADGGVEQWISKEDGGTGYYANRVNAGLHVLSRKVLDIGCDSKQIDLDRQILKPLAGTGAMFAYDSPEYVKDMGTPERYRCVCNEFADGLVFRRNLKNRQKAIFLDRDGTINEYVGFLTNINEFKLKDDAAEAIRKINGSDYLAIVVTNQPVIARGEISTTQLEEIHNKMETLLGECGAFINAIYYCPHHPDSGFEGEISELKIDCNCRKPAPGMLRRAAKEYNIDLAESWIVGDSNSDIKCGKKAGCKTAMIGRNSEANLNGLNLLDCITKIIG